MALIAQADFKDKTALVKDWARGYESQPNEYSYWIDEIEGTIPPELQGTFFRNGPGSLEVNGQKFGHPFDGDGMICAITFNQGRAHFKNRYVRTEGYLKEQAEGKILYRGFGTQKPGGWLANIFDTNFKNAANTSVIYWGGKLWAMWEGGQPHQLDPETLETIGKDDLNGLLEDNHPFSAHPKIINNKFINFGVKGILFQTLNIFELDELGNKLKQQFHSLTGYAFLHDMLVTDNYYIFMQHPFEVDGLPFLLGFKSIEQCFDFNPNQPTKILVISRHGDRNLEVLETESFFGFHHGNAWEKDGKIYLESVCSDAFPKMKQAELDLANVDFNDIPKGELWEFELDLASKKVDRRKIESRGCEFPMINPNWVGRENRYTYMLACNSLTANGPLQTIIKLDKESGEKQLWNISSREFAGEPVFVPRPDGTKEDDGWLVVCVYDAATHKSHINILDAQNLDNLIGRLHLKHHIPHGFHGNWTSKVFI